LAQIKMDAQSARIDELVRAAVANAMEEHRRVGRSIVVWRDGQVVTIPPEEIPVRPITQLPVARKAT